jgi:hypothetical protein
MIKPGLLFPAIKASGYQLLLCIVLGLVSPMSRAQSVPVDCNKYFAAIGYSVYVCGTGSAQSPTLTALPTVTSGGYGLAIGPSFSYPTSNPTFWMSHNGTWSYYNGTNFTNTTHTVAASAVISGGSKNYLYGLTALNGQVLKYGGSSASTVVATIPSFTASGYAYEILGDDLDNFYLLRLQTPQALEVYSSSGSLVTSYSVTGVATNTPFGWGFAIIGNTVTLSQSNGHYHTGIMNGGVINFSLGSSTLLYPGGDFASCPVTTAFISTISATPSTSLTCINTTLNLAATTTAAVSSYSWSGPGLLSGSTSSTALVNAPGVYSCNLVSAVGGTSTCTYTVVNGNAITVVMTPSVICAGNTVTLSASGASSYTWSPGGGNGSTKTLTPTNSGTYQVTGSSGGCTFSTTGNYVVNAVPVVSITLPYYACVGNTITGTTYGNADTYVWMPGSTSGTQAVLTPTATMIYTVIGTNTITGCAKTQTRTIFAYVTPTVAAFANTTTICSGLSALLTCTGNISGGSSSYIWHPGPIYNPSPFVTPTATTIYTVVASNAGGLCPSDATIQITVLPTPTVVLSISNNSFCSGPQVTITPTGGINYTLNPGYLTGNSSFVVTPSISVIYTVTGSNTVGCTARAFASLTVASSPTLVLNASPTVACSGQSTTLSVSGANNYFWQPGSMVGNLVTVSPTTSITYSVIGFNTNGCQATNTIALTTQSAPVVSLAQSASSICATGIVSLTASGASTYSWQPSVAGTSLVTVAPNVSTTYTVTGFNSSGCPGSATAAIAVYALPQLSFTAPASICAGNSATLNVSGAQSYLWQPGNIAGNILVDTPAASTTYTAAGTSTAGCVSSSMVTVAVAPNPTVLITSPTNTLCSGNSAVLGASGAQGYTWSPGNLVGSTATIAPAQSVTYTVTGLTGNCYASNTMAIQVFTVPIISVSGQPSVCSGQSVSLSATGSASYTWQPGGQQSNPLVTAPSITTSYTAHTQSAAGCTAAAVWAVSVAPAPTLVAQSPPANCGQLSFTLSASGANTYTWQPGATNSNSLVVAPSAQGSYTVVGAIGLCSAQRVLTVTPMHNPTLSVISTSSIVCAGQTVTLTAFGADSYSWSSGGTGSVAIVSPTITTSYILKGSNNNSCTDLLIFNQQVSECLGINDQLYQDFVVFPNPNNGLFYLRVGSTVNSRMEIRVFTSTGQQILKKNVTEPVPEIDLTSYSNGLYTVVICGDGQQRTVTRIIKQ